ncbi:MAG: hemolysin III family protein [Alteromonadaceae bacterium]|nr:hemolysin III family protein [Alteromonadaceae bacterium]
MANTATGYSPLEEALNIYSHLLGFVLSVLGTIFLVMKAVDGYSNAAFASALVFGLSMLTLYLASTLYHRAVKPSLRAKLRVFDHCAIFILIAGTYTPFALLVLEPVTGWWIFGIIWSLAAIGITLKLFFTGRFKILSTSIYLFMGWLILFVGKSLMAALSPEAAFWLVAGGISYTVGAVLYAIKSLPLNHAVFHVFVLGGTACHFVSVYAYVL